MDYDAANYLSPDSISPLALKTPTERIAYLRDFLRALSGERFNLSDWLTVDGNVLQVTAEDARRHLCKTTACIGGWAELLFSDEADLHEEDLWELLGIDEETADSLFWAKNCKIPFEDITNLQAADVLQIYLDTGTVAWERIS